MESLPADGLNIWLQSSSGNAIYYFSLVPYLPDSLRHQGFAIDGGVLVDFVVCVLVYGLIRLGARVRRG